MADYDVIVLGTGAAGLTAARDRGGTGRERRPVREGRDDRRHDRLLGRDDLDPAQPARAAGEGRHARAGRSSTSRRCRTTRSPTRWRRPTSTSAPRWCAGSTSARRSSSVPCPISRTTTPSRRGGLAAGRTLARDGDLPLRRARRVGRPRPHLAVLPELPPDDRRDDARPGDPGGARPGGDAAPRRERRAGHGPRARRPAAQGVPGPRRRAADRAPWRRADHGGRRGRGRRVRDARGTQGGARAERGHRDRRVRAQRRPQARVPARAVHAHGRRRDERGRRPEDGHARSARCSGTCARRGGCR